MKYNDFKDINELTACLGEQMKRVIAGEMPHQELSALSQSAGRVMTRVKLQMDYCTQRNEEPDIKFLGMNDMKKKFNKGEDKAA